MWHLPARHIRRVGGGRLGHLLPAPWLGDLPKGAFLVNPRNLGGRGRRGSGRGGEEDVARIREWQHPLGIDAMAVGPGYFCEEENLTNSTNLAHPCYPIM